VIILALWTCKLVKLRVSQAVARVTRVVPLALLCEIATDISDEGLKILLLREVTQEWFTIRGFSVASRLLEHYKLQLKRISKAPKEQEKNCISMLVEITLNLI